MLRFVVLLSIITVCKTVCPCESQELCQQIREQRNFEVFVFDVGGNTWKSYNWSMVTTVATFGKYDPELMCYAHSKGARVVLIGDVPLSHIVDKDNRTAWILEKVELVKSQFLDGINFDIEQDVKEGSPEYYALTDLVRETVDAFHWAMPGSQVSFDAAWSPKCVDGRCYDYAAIAEASDLLFVMSYDEQSQITEDCIAMANAPLAKTLNGYKEYLDLNISPKKLVMGVPWYGYDYICLNMSKEDICYIKETPFHGAPCSDAAGKQKPYSWIMKQINSSISGRKWDIKQQAPYFNYKDEQKLIHQVWYDDPQSICAKADFVLHTGLRGIGMWNGNSLDYSDVPVAKQQTARMWDALLGC